MPRSALPVILLLALLAGAVPAAAADVSVTPLLDLRLRQEILEGVYHFDPADPDRNWLRQRVRAGIRMDQGRHRFVLRVDNENRHYLGSRTGVDWDELILGRALVSWRIGERNRLTVGRQDVIWDDGFLMLEGHPLDGSRSIYHDAVRLELERSGWRADLVAVADAKRDGIVLSGDEDRALSDADERGLALRLARGGWSGTIIWKDEDDPDGLLPDLETFTWSLRRSADGPRGWFAELAVQRQVGPTAAATEAGATPTDGWALAGQLFARNGVGGVWSWTAGGYYYSGAGQGLRPFRAPWGRWPKWSEMYIYTLIGESTPGRVHVAAWENLSAPRVTVRRPLGSGLTLAVGADYLLAPADRWRARGLLTRLELRAALGPRTSGHLLWERLQPGAFHDGRHGLPPLTETIHFLRWQIAWSL